MPACINYNLALLSALGQCSNSIGGIKSLWVAEYTPNVYPALVFLNNQIVSIPTGILFTALDFNKQVTKLTNTYDVVNQFYQYTLTLEILKVDYRKRQGIDILIKGSFIFLYEDNNGQFFLLGEKSGLNTLTYQDNTDVKAGKSAYTFTLGGKASYLPYGVDPALVHSFTTVDCSVLNDELALSSPLFFTPYYDCLVGNLPGFIEP